MHSNEDFEVGSIGCWLMALALAAVVMLCVWRYHHPLPTPAKKVSIEAVMYRLPC